MIRTTIGTLATLLDHTEEAGIPAPIDARASIDDILLTVRVRDIAAWSIWLDEPIDSRPTADGHELHEVKATRDGIDTRVWAVTLKDAA